MVRRDTGWREQLASYLATLDGDELAALHAESIQRLDRATRVRPLEDIELARLSALAQYLTPRIERQQPAGAPDFGEAVLLGLMAGYHLGVSEHLPVAPDPFAS